MPDSYSVLVNRSDQSHKTSRALDLVYNWIEEFEFCYTAAFRQKSKKKKNVSSIWKAKPDMKNSKI